MHSEDCPHRRRVEITRIRDEELRIRREADDAARHAEQRSVEAEEEPEVDEMPRWLNPDVVGRNFTVPRRDPRARTAPHGDGLSTRRHFMCVVPGLYEAVFGEIDPDGPISPSWHPPRTPTTLVALSAVEAHVGVAGTSVTVTFEIDHRLLADLVAAENGMGC
jgi:hypothetical protein